MVGKAHLAAYPDRKERATQPLQRVHMDLITSSVKSIEGYLYALVVVDDATDYRWVYGLKTKCENFAAVKKWYSDIADLRARFPLIEP